MAIYKNDQIEYVKEAIDSILFQNLLPLEFIIVIDGFINTSLEFFLKNIIHPKVKVKLIKLKKNEGLANALNIGVEASTTGIIARMDSDDISKKDRFEKQIAYLIKNSLDIVGGQIAEFEKDKNVIKSIRKVPLSHDKIVRFMKKRSPFSHPTIVFRKEVFEKLEGYNVKIFPEDYDFFVRAYLEGFKFGNLNDVLLWFRLGEDNDASLKRRHGYKYAINEFKLFNRFYKLGFYNVIDYIKVFLTRIPLRLIPFNIFKFIYFKMLR